jgi:hypothetical protein
MWCKSVRSQLSAYADGELTVSEARAVEEHLAQCESCARENSSLQLLVRLTSAIPAEDAPASLHGRIMTKLSYDTEPIRRLAPRSRMIGLSAFSPWTWTAMTGAAAALFLGLQQPTPEPGAPAGETSRTVRVQPSHRSSAGPARTPVREPRKIVVTTPQLRHAMPSHEAASKGEPQPEAKQAAALAHAKVALPIRRPTPQPPLTAASPAKPVLEPRAGDTPGPAPVVTQGMLAVMPGEPVINAVTSPPPPDLPMAIEKDSGSPRMAGTPPETDIPAEDDEGLRGIRMFLEERSRMVPQPPTVGDRRMRKL